MPGRTTTRPTARLTTMMHRVLTHITFLLTSAIGVAQAPYLLKLDAPPGLYQRNMLFDRIGTDLYRVAGVFYKPDTAWMYRAEMDATGLVQNGALVRCDSGSAGQYPSVLVPTSDGGLLFSYLNVAGGTDKQTFAKLDATGAVEWARHYPDNFGIFLNDDPTAMEEKDGHYFVLGHRQDVPANVGWSSTMLEVDSTGACVSLHTWAAGDYFSDLGRGLMRTADNGLYTVSVLRPYSGSSSFPRLSVQRWNAALQVDWSYTYSLGNYHLQNDALLLQDGGLLLSGQVRFGIGGTPFRPYFLRLDSTGQVVWSRVVLVPQLSPQAVVEEPDGSFTALVFRDSLPLMLAHLDTNGALLSATGTDALPNGTFPMDLVRDAGSGEHLVLGVGNHLARLDANGLYACGNQPLTWTDSVVTVQPTAFPVTVTTSSLASYPIGWSTSPLTLFASYPCLSTAVSGPDPRPEPFCWPVPASNELFVALGEGMDRAVPCSVHDATGRCVLRSIAAAQDGGVVRLDVSTLAAGVHIVVLHLPEGDTRVVMVK